MLAEMEAGLVNLVKLSALKAKLNAVGTLPDLDGDNLVKRMAADAPAVYVVAGRPFPATDGMLRVSFGLACVARNARGHEDARRGDGKVIGLYPMLESVLGLAAGGLAGGYVWRVTGVEFMNDEAIWNNGLTVGVVIVEATPAMPQGIDASLLSDFITFHADYDVQPFETAAEHDKWAAEPPDYSTSKPELQDDLTIPQ